MVFEKKYFFFNRTIIHHACESGNYDLIKYLIHLDNIDITVNSIFNLFLIQFYLKMIYFVFINID